MRSLQHFYITTTILSSSARFQANANRDYCQALMFGAYKLLHFSHQTKGLESNLRFQTSPFRSGEIVAAMERDPNFTTSPMNSQTSILTTLSQIRCFATMLTLLGI